MRHFDFHYVGGRKNSQSRSAIVSFFTLRRSELGVRYSAFKKPSTAFTLAVASHCVVATRAVDLRRSTRDLRLSHPSKNLRNLLVMSSVDRKNRSHPPKKTFVPLVPSCEKKITPRVVGTARGAMIRWKSEPSVTER